MNIEGLLDIHELSQYREQDSELMCRDRAPEGRLVCTRTMNHGSLHIAHSGEKTVRQEGHVVLGVWGNAKPLGPREDEGAAGEPLAFTIMVPVGEGRNFNKVARAIQDMVNQMEYPTVNEKGESAPLVLAGVTIVTGARQAVDGVPIDDDGEIPIVTVIRPLTSFERTLMQDVTTENIGFIGSVDDEEPNNGGA